MRRFVVLAALLGACGSEREIRSNLPPLGVPYDRPLDVVTQSDKLVQTPVPVVDILWIIDNSTSMADDQTDLIANFPAFMSYFLGSGLDYHIGVISTDFAGDQGRLRYEGGVKWVEPETPDPVATFSALANLGTRIGTNEMGRDPAYAALELHDGPGGFNEGFERDDGGLHLVVISDEDDHSTQITVPEFAEYLEASRPDPDEVTFSGLVTPPGGCFPNGSEPGLDYVELSGLVGGLVVSICNTDWIQVLEQLGVQASGLHREYFLSELPVPETIVVWVEVGDTVLEFEPEIDWTYSLERNSVVFVEFVPSALAEVHIDYEVLGADVE